MMSIRRRFLLISVIAVTFALAAASIVLVHIFTDSYGQRIEAELTGHINRLAASLDFAPDGRLLVPESPADNRFLSPYGGLYWQIEDAKRKSELRSPSLFDYSLPLPSDAHAPGVVHRYRLKGPEGFDVVVLERTLVVAAPEGTRIIRIAVAVNADEIDAARSTFAFAILPYIGALAAFLVATSLIQLWVGLRPLQKVADDLDAVRSRKVDRLPGPYPRELEGLIGQLNRLLETQADAIRKARSRASDLAHGLKTPLTVLSNDAFSLREKGETEMADELDQLTQAMLAHIDHELARARIAQSSDQRRSDAAAAKIIGDLVRTLRKTEAGETLSWSIDVPDTLFLPIDPHDFRELTGNLLENASKWAQHRVGVKVGPASGGWRLLVEDDGPGAPDDKLAELSRRGVRLDHLKPGSGLGLSIVDEIAKVYGLSLTFGKAEAGGFSAEVIFPAEEPKSHAEGTKAIKASSEARP